MDYVISILPSMFLGWLLTMQIFAVTLLSMPLGVILGIARVSKFKPLAWIMEVYVWVFRGTPLLLQLLFWYFGLMAIGFRIERETAVYAAFILNYAAYLAEIFRSGIQSIDIGQYEAADVLGLSRRQTMTQIILPQVFRRVLPPIGNEVINLVKDTALVYIIAISELSRVARIRAVTDDTLIPFVIAAIFYLLMTAVVQRFFKWVEARMNYYH
jgi:polar amino acid transport system permease protein